MKQRARLKEYARYIVTGTLNTAVDFIVLNGMFLLLGGPAQGAVYVLLKTVSFSCASINSYFLNKYWVFPAQANGAGGARPAGGAKQKSRFVLVTVIGFVVNVAVAAVVFRLFGSAPTGNKYVSANLGALFGTAASLVWNYIGYKFFVFKSASADAVAEEIIANEYEL